MLIRQEEEQERRETLENDRLVREAEHQRILREGTTFHQHAQSHANDEAGGRFASVNAVSVVGAEPAVRYPAAGAHQCDPVGTEPPLGFSVNDLEPSMGTTRPTEDTGGAPSSAPPGDVAAPPPSSNGADDGAA